MNEPIISPWLIYWIGRLTMIHGFSCVLGFLLTIFTVVLGVMIITNDTDELFLNRVKKLACVTIIVDVLALFMPTKTEVIAMYTASYVTPANVKAAGEFADKAVDKLIEKILKASETAKGK